MREVICLDSAFTFVLLMLKTSCSPHFVYNIYMCALWVKCTKSTFHMFIVSYNCIDCQCAAVPAVCSLQLLTQAVQCLENVYTV